MNKDLDTQYRSIYLLPGKMALCTTPSKVTTILGSCIAIILYSKIHKIGSICHAIYPDCKLIGLQETPPDKLYSFVDTGLYSMLRLFIKRSILKNEIKAKVFGGAHITNNNAAVDQQKGVGVKNIEAVYTLLENENIVIASKSVGGAFGRKLIFYSDTGDVYVKDQVPKNATANNW